MNNFQKCPLCNGNLSSLTKLGERRQDDYVCGTCFSRFSVVAKLVCTLDDPFGIAEHKKQQEAQDGDGGV